MGKLWKRICVWRRGGNSRYNVEDDDYRSGKKNSKITSNYFISKMREHKETEEFGSSLAYSSLPNIPLLINNQERRRQSSVNITPSHMYREAEHWKKEQVLGCGQYGTCYQCLDVLTGHLMAVKQVPFMGSTLDVNSNTTSLKDEIVLLSRLNHPNVIRIMGATQDNSHFNIFMEWMPGGSVSSLLEKFGAFHENVIISYTRQVLTGLAYLHDNKILHRDLKGSNLLVDGSGLHLKISDFGTAGCLHSQTTAEGEFEGQLTGTIPFMAPEVIRGENYGRSSDIWSVGCVIIEMITACLPWTTPDTTGLNHYQLMYKIARTTEPPPIPTNKITNSTRNMMMKCLKIEPDRRPSAKELLSHTVFTFASGTQALELISTPPSSPCSSVDRPVLIRRTSAARLSVFDTWRSEELLIGESADI